MRGEYLLEANSGPDRLELPPRARRIQLPTMWGWPVLGTTSACAENTVHGACGNNTRRNYLRVRGEYRRCRPRCSFVRELPPRARRIRQRSRRPHRARGTTSACAENTRFYAAQTGCIRNYLRVRGEYALLRSSDRVYSELPPRARRIPGATLRDFQKHGTTSACAENTLRRSSRHSLTRNYLRVRGEYAGENIKNRFNEELPPRARRILSIRPINQQDNGTTSACAENTHPRYQRCQ